MEESQQPTVGAGEHRYLWIEEWAAIPDQSSARTGWAEHGVALTAAATVVVSHPARPSLIELDKDGSLLGARETPLTLCHGITATAEAGVGYLWVADVGARCDPDHGYAELPSPPVPRVVKIDEAGDVVAELAAPPLAAYRGGQRYLPTSVAVFEERLGGNGDIWLADGYGANLVHRYGWDGTYLDTITGDEGTAGAFDCPHTLWINAGSEPELWVTDRRHNRIQIYDLDGAFKECFGDDFLVRPTGLAALPSGVAVIELFGRLTILDESHRPCCTIGDNLRAQKTPGWPNELDTAGNQARSNSLRAGRFNSPHGAAKAISTSRSGSSVGATSSWRSSADAVARNCDPAEA